MLLAAYLFDDLFAVWLVIRGDGPEDARSVVGSLSLYPYVEIKDIMEAQEIPLEPESSPAGEVLFSCSATARRGKASVYREPLSSRAAVTTKPEIMTSMPNSKSPSRSMVEICDASPAGDRELLRRQGGQVFAFGLGQ